MSIAHLLEEFGGAFPSSPEQNLLESVADTELLDSFEQGYKAGWEDAVRAKTEERAGVSADFARNLKDLSFTYHEARTAMIAEFAPVVERAVMTVLPEISRQSIGIQVASELTAITSQNSETQVVIVTAPENYETVIDLLPKDVNFPIDVVRDAGLSSGQVRFQFGQKERQIDLDEVLEIVSRAFSGFTHETRREAAHG